MKRLALLAVLLLTSAAGATDLYDVQWSQVQTWASSSFPMQITTGTQVVESIPRTAEPSGLGACVVFDATGVIQCPTEQGTIAWIENLAPNGSVDPRWGFFAELESTSAHEFRKRWHVGRKQYAAPPPPVIAKNAAIGFAEGQLVKGSVPIQVTTSGLATGPLKYLVFIDGVQKGVWQTPATTITQWWQTPTVVNGTHALKVTVTDSMGKIATASVGVLVKN